jgi:protein gp37
MGTRTGIEWTDATWNPVRGCSRVSEGCRNCYAEGVAARFSGPGQPFEGFADRARTGSKWTGKVALVPKALRLPLSWRTPKRIFVNSMSDLFHESLSDDAIDEVFSVMGQCDDRGLGHVFQVLTKRHERMARYMATRARQAWNRARLGPDAWPARNLWLGVSVENQAEADRRIPHLLAVPAKVRFLSCEPLLGPVDLHSALCRETGSCPTCPQCLGGIDWVIAGGESGPGARPMHPDWARGLRNQCADAGVPYFFKQWGAFEPVTIIDDGCGMVTASGRDWRGPAVDDGADILLCAAQDHRGEPRELGDGFWASGDGRLMHHAGKKAAGALLDGVEHKAFPA